MPELKVFYYLFLLTLLDTTSPIRPSLHGHNNGEHFCLSSSVIFSLILSLFLSLPVTISMLIEEIRLLSDDDNGCELQEPIIPKASRRDATLAKKRDDKSLRNYNVHAPRGTVCDEGHVARELYAPSAVTQPARAGEPRISGVCFSNFFAKLLR